MSFLAIPYRVRYFCVAAIIIGLMISFFTSPDGERMERALFITGFGRVSRVQTVNKTIRAYNAASAGIYSTGGTVADVLGNLPAFPLEKRRLYKDIQMLRDDNLLIVFDKDVEKVQSVAFMGPERAVAVSQETWGLVMQDFTTRKPVSNLKASVIQCRYHLYRHEGKWQVSQVEVFPDGEEIPPMNIKSIL